MKKWIMIVLVAAMAIPVMTSDAFAFRSYLNEVNAACGTTYGCGICHVNPSGGGALNAGGTGYMNSGYDPTYFCPAPPPPPPCTDADGDGFFMESGCGTPVDCNDNDPTVYPGAPEICNDGKDNDCDGSTDCSDTNCANDPSCAPPPPPCTDADGDGFFKESGCGSPVDCDDNDPTVYPGAPEVCNDGKDNDCDGNVDCADTNCTNDQSCSNPPSCTDADGDGYFAEPNCGTSVDCDDNNPNVNTGMPEICDDGIDNDCDGLIDCADNECTANQACSPPQQPEVCNDGIDNDGDGYVDCADRDCRRDPNCYADPKGDKKRIEGRGKSCRDGIDNDGDGLFDCDDPDCVANKACIEGKGKSCSDGIDNDGDGLTDCDDPDCIRNRACRDANNNTGDGGGDGGDDNDGQNPPPVPEPDGAQLYSDNCASCHRSIDNSQVHGKSARDIQHAIDEDKGGMGFLNFLTPEQIQKIADALR